MCRNLRFRRRAREDETMGKIIVPLQVNGDAVEVAVPRIGPSSKPFAMNWA